MHPIRTAMVQWAILLASERQSRGMLLAPTFAEELLREMVPLLGLRRLESCQLRFQMDH